MSVHNGRSGERSWYGYAVLKDLWKNKIGRDNL